MNRDASLRLTALLASCVTGLALLAGCRAAEPPAAAKFVQDLVLGAAAAFLF